MTQKIGLEVANGYIKVVSDDSEAVYPNRLKMLTGSEFSLTGTIGTIYEFNNKKYILDEKGDSSGGRSADRYLSDDYLLETLVAISQVIKERNVALTIGVPCRDFEIKGLKEKITNHLKGRHVLYVSNNLEEEKEEYVINIEDVYVVVEPLGTLCEFVFDEKLQIVNNRDNFSYVIIDIGYSTTDILATNGLRIDKIFGDDIGCMDISNDYVRAINKLQVDNGYSFTLDDITLENKAIINKYGEKFDFTNTLNEIKTGFVRRLETSVKKSGINKNNYDRIIYTGGGALALKDQIKLGHNEVIYSDAQLANARGFWKFTLIKKG